MDAVSVLYMALASEHGVALVVQDFTRVRAALYKARRENPEFTPLRFRQGRDGELWITKDKSSA